jgi:hypothetical protein
MTSHNAEGTHAGAVFGEGIYLAEEVGKCDQYVQVDKALDANGPLAELCGAFRWT